MARILPLFLIIVWGVGLRFLDLNDPPLDFTAWRQLRSATIARGMYYDMLPDNGNPQLIPILSLSLAPFAELVIERAKQQSNISKAAFICIGLIALDYLSLQSYRELKSRDYREEIKGWIQMGNQIPVDSRLIGLTHDYNNRLAYYGWRDVAQWPHLSDYEMLSLAGGNYDPKDKSVLEEFKRRTHGYDYFIVTLFLELDSQATLKTLLQENYPSISGEGFILYDLREMK